MVLLYLKNNQDQYFSVDQHAGKFSSTPFLWQLERVNELDKSYYLFPHGHREEKYSFFLNLVGNEVYDGEPITCFSKKYSIIGVLSKCIKNRIAIGSSYIYHENILYCELPSYAVMLK